MFGSYFEILRLLSEEGSSKKLHPVVRIVIDHFSKNNKEPDIIGLEFLGQTKLIITKPEIAEELYVKYNKVSEKSISI